MMVIDQINRKEGPRYRTPRQHSGSADVGYAAGYVEPALHDALGRSYRGAWIEGSVTGPGTYKGRRLPMVAIHKGLL